VVDCQLQFLCHRERGRLAGSGSCSTVACVYSTAISSMRVSDSLHSFLRGEVAAENPAQGPLLAGEREPEAGARRNCLEVREHTCRRRLGFSPNSHARFCGGD